MKTPTPKQLADAEQFVRDALASLGQQCPEETIKAAALKVAKALPTPPPS